MVYIVEGNEIYHCHPDETGSKELFLTVHPTKDSTKTTEEQAAAIADKLNEALYGN